MQIAICPNCNINTAGNHARNCPFNPNYNSSNTMIYNQPNNILTSPKNMKKEKEKLFTIWCWLFGHKFNQFRYYSQFFCEINNPIDFCARCGTERKEVIKKLSNFNPPLII